MKKINKKTFGDLDKEHKEVNNCVICCEDFKDTDEIAELNCHDKHIFHSSCI